MGRAFCPGNIPLSLSNQPIHRAQQLFAQLGAGALLERLDLPEHALGLDRLHHSSRALVQGGKLGFGQAAEHLLKLPVERRILLGQCADLLPGPFPGLNARGQAGLRGLCRLLGRVRLPGAAVQRVGIHAEESRYTLPGGR